MNNKALSLLLLIGISTVSFRIPSKNNSERLQFFHGSYDNAIRMAKKQQKPLLLDFWANWCGPCKKMDNETFKNPEVARYLNEHYIVYKVDADSFDGIEIAQRFGIKAYPNFVILNNKGKYIETLSGYFPPTHFLEKLQNSANQNTPLHVRYYVNQQSL